MELFCLKPKCEKMVFVGQHRVVTGKRVFDASPSPSSLHEKFSSPRPSPLYEKSQVRVFRPGAL